ncbi:hypothetical protein DFS33DRAFT_1344211 [Desarmillaria ectypa]|nr:hypothetical protein DFS33DRAFT_1344211 [Desarmillaria ectypa]
MNPHSSDEDDDAPEAVTLSQSRKLIQQQNSSIRQFENAQKEKKRAKNRERDRKLKEQAQGRKKGKGKEAVDEGEDRESSGDEGDNDAIARMRRAMKEAGEESDEDMDDDAEMHDEEEESDEEEEEEFHGFDAPRKSNHLPDHLFTSAAASVPSSIEKKAKSKSPKEAEKTRKRKRSTSNKAKDRVLGSRIIRALPDPNKPPSGTSSMIPTAKIRKFLDRSLSLRKADRRVGGWERKSANIGSMKINHGPAAHFVRQQS